MNFEVSGLNEINETSVEGSQSDPQPPNIMGKSNAHTSSQSAPPCPSSSRLSLIDFEVISQAMWNDVITRLTTLEKKV